MKCFRRFCCVLFSFALLSTVFSITANAETINVKPHHIYHTVKFTDKNNTTGSADSANVIPNDGITQTKEKPSATTSLSTAMSANITYVNTYAIANNDESVLFTDGRLIKLRLENALYMALMYNTSQGNGWYHCTPQNISATVKYKDGSTANVNGASVTSNGNDGNIDIYLEFTPSKDVYSVTFTVTSSISQDLSDPGFVYDLGWDYTDYIKLTGYAGEYKGDDKFQLSIDQSTEESGLLSGLINWVKNISNSVTSGFENLGNKLNEVWTSIKELPQKIWGYIENGLKALFIPSESFIKNYKGMMDELLSRKFGAIYQVVDITLNSWDRIQASDAQNTIEIPKATINVSNDTQFSFGGYSVPIVPQGFEFLVAFVKMAVGVACTLLFVNGMRKKYDEVMGVEQ